MNKKDKLDRIVESLIEGSAKIDQLPAFVNVEDKGEYYKLTISDSQVEYKRLIGKDDL